MLPKTAQEANAAEPIAKSTQDLAEQNGVRYVSNLGLENWQPADSHKYDLI